ncbi:hypothetical protein [Nocardia sp. NPDC057227]|uniref:hypothetical protein n=1 Tax=Nocardia sp. NPDC057227 TaxID=3346056 RepID=UPI00363FC648
MHLLAVGLRFTARRLLALSNRLSPPVPLPASHPAARAVLARAGLEKVGPGCWRYTGSNGTPWLLRGSASPGVQLTPMSDPYSQEKP